MKHGLLAETQSVPILSIHGSYAAENILFYTIYCCILPWLSFAGWAGLKLIDRTNRTSFYSFESGTKAVWSHYYDHFHYLINIFGIQMNPCLLSNHIHIFVLFCYQSSLFAFKEFNEKIFFSEKKRNIIILCKYWTLTKCSWALLTN